MAKLIVMGGIRAYAKAYQFNCWNKNDPNEPNVCNARQIPSREFAQAGISIGQVIEGNAPEPTGGATHYYAIAMKTPPA